MSLRPYVHLDVALAGRGAGDELELPRDAHHHLTRVLRLGEGAPLLVSDGHGAEVAATLAGQRVRLGAAPATSPAPSPTLTVLQGLPRGRKLDEVVRQVTELGVDRIVPVAAARSVTRLDGVKADRAVERWTAVARAAAEQARRPFRPTVAPLRPVADAADGLAPGTRLLVAHVGADRSLLAALDDRDGAGEAAPDHLAVAIGPEGGWDDDEVAAFEAVGAVPVGLGPTVLRTEHAAAAALAVLAAVGGRWEHRVARPRRRARSAGSGRVHHR